MQNISGQEVDYEAFKSDYDANPEKYDNIIADFSEKGVTLNPDSMEPELPEEPTGESPGIQSSAKRAASHTLKKK